MTELTPEDIEAYGQETQLPSEKQRLMIEPKLTSDLKGFGSPTGRLGKAPSIHDWGVIKRQASLYAQGLFESYRAVQPMPARVIDDQAIPNAEDAFLRHYNEAELPNLTAMSWWNKKFGVPVLVNKITKREYMSYTDLVRPETVEAMARPLRSNGFSMRFVYRRKPEGWLW